MGHDITPQILDGAETHEVEVNVEKADTVIMTGTQLVEVRHHSANGGEQFLTLFQQLGVGMTATGLLIPDGLEVQNWSQLAETVVRLGQATPWITGDALLFGQTKYGETYKLFAKDFRLGKGTLHNYVTVCRAFPQTARREHLSFAHHQAVVALYRKDQAQAEALLEEAEEHYMPVATLRKRARTIINALPGSATTVPDMSPMGEIGGGVREESGSATEATGSSVGIRGQTSGGILPATDEQEDELNIADLADRQHLDDRDRLPSDEDEARRIKDEELNTFIHSAQQNESVPSTAAIRHLARLKYELDLRDDLIRERDERIEQLERQLEARHLGLAPTVTDPKDESEE